MAERKEDFDIALYNIILLGKTGNGKSATGNTILGNDLFHSKASTASCTKCCTLECAQFLHQDGAVLVRVVDTPGLIDTVDSQADILCRICEAMSLCPEGFNALVIVLRFASRWTKDELEALRILKRTFGPELMKYCIIIMTHGMNFDTEYENKPDNLTFMEWCKEQTNPPELFQLFQECDYRIVLFYNKGKYEKEKKESVAKFWELIEKRQGRYTNLHFSKCVEEREKLILELKLPQLKPKIQEKISLLKGELLKAMESDQVRNVLPFKKRAKQLIEELKKENRGNSLDDFTDTLENVILEVDEIQNIDAAERNRYFKLVDKYLRKKSYLEGFEFPKTVWRCIVEFFHMVTNPSYYIDKQVVYIAIKTHVAALEKQIKDIKDKLKKSLSQRRLPYKEVTEVGLSHQLEDKGMFENVSF